MKKLLLILICLFVSFEVKSDDEKIYLDFKKNEKQFHEELLNEVNDMISFGFSDNEIDEFISEKIQDGENETLIIKLKKKYSDLEKKKLIQVLKEKVFEEPSIYLNQFVMKNSEFKKKLELIIERGFINFSKNEKELIDKTLSFLDERSSIEGIKLIGVFSETQQKHISKTLVQNFFKKRKSEKQYYACMSKYSKGQMEAFEIGIIGESCKMLLSNDKKKQKRGKCTLKEIGKHSQMVLRLKYLNCQYQNE